VTFQPWSVLCGIMLMERVIDVCCCEDVFIVVLFLLFRGGVRLGSFEAWIGLDIRAMFRQ
jgi:hypothetical protein